MSRAFPPDLQALLSTIQITHPVEEKKESVQKINNKMSEEQEDQEENGTVVKAWKRELNGLLGENTEETMYRLLENSDRKDL